MNYHNYYRWFLLEMRLLQPYTYGWLFKWGKFPWNLLVLLLYVYAVLGAWAIWWFSPREIPWVADARFVRFIHTFMKGEYLWQKRSNPLYWIQKRK